MNGKVQTNSFRDRVECIMHQGEYNIVVSAK